MPGLVRGLAAGLVTLPTMPAKLGMLANELTMLSKLRAPVLAAVSSVGPEAEFNVTASGFATVLAAPAKIGIRSAMLLAILSIEGGAEGAEGVGAAWAEPPTELANPASDGMLAAMMSVTPARVGKKTPRSDPPTAGGGASSPEEDTVMSSSDIS